ncbi:hypothetical protein [Nostoc sp.]
MTTAIQFTLNLGKSIAIAFPQILTVKFVEHKISAIADYLT